MNWIDEANDDMENRRKISEEVSHTERVSISRKYTRSLRDGISKEHAKKMSNAGIKSQKKSGKIMIFQKAGTLAAAESAKRKQQQKYIEFLSLLPNTDITWKMAEEATLAIGYKPRQIGRLVESQLGFQKHLKDKSGRTRWRVSTYKKQD